MQESYLRVWRRQAIRPIASAKNFLFSIARHLAVDFLRRERVCSVMPVADLSELAIRDEKPGVAETASANEELSLLLEAIDRLPHRCREIMIRRKLQGESQRQIAQSLGISELTVQTQVARGTRRCEEFMREKGLVAETEP